ncbi:MAG: PglZ domain-containing protein [Cryomorphaceae bacterium]|nr:PglZ domain-containing protein [Cryomorphaceae bacterium]
MQVKILWADDEIELLKPHIMFLENKGYSVDPVNNGADAVEKSNQQDYDIVFLDENMPGISGLEALNRIKESKPYVPVVMITKSEEEHIMEEAIGSKIADYLIKPVNPNQILLSIKKNLDQSKLVSQKTNLSYQQEFRQLGMRLTDPLDAEEWADLYGKLVYWELELESAQDSGMKEILGMQKKEANKLFSRFVERNYIDWINGDEDAPVLIHTLVKDKIIPLSEKRKTFVLVIDNLRYDQWKVLQPVLSKSFTLEKEEIVYSILPTATHYARNAFFAGLMPSEISKRFPQFWKNEEEEGGKNAHEKDFLEANLKRLGKNVKWSYNKITNLDAGKRLSDQFSQLKENDLNFIVYNFVAYRSLTVSWFEHSPLNEIVKKIAESGARLIITTDHGTVKVSQPVKIVGERSTNSNLRYKVGRGLSYNEKEVFRVADPSKVHLPSGKFAAEFVFAREDDYFVYPNNYNQFVNYYANTFQHGGISMEEVLIPFVVMDPK